MNFVFFDVDFLSICGYGCGKVIGFIYGEEGCGRGLYGYINYMFIYKFCYVCRGKD